MGLGIEVIQWHDPSGQNLIYRWPESGSTDIKFGAQLVVHESQNAIFFRDGQALDLFGPGRHTLSTQNIPLLGKLLGAIFSGGTPFPASVVFVSRKEFRNFKWGTKQPINFRDTELDFVRLRAFGKYSLKITDPMLFVSTMCGSEGRYFMTEIEESFRDSIVQKLNDLLGEQLKTVFDLSGKFNELSIATKLKCKEDFARFGLELTDFTISSITPPEEVQSLIDQRSGMKAIGNMNQFMQFKTAMAMGDAAKNPGAAGSTIGLGMGMGIGGMIPGMMAQGMAAQAGPAVPPPLPQKQYFIAHQGQQKGPMDLGQARSFLQSIGSTDGVLAWAEGLPQWTPVNQMAEFSIPRPPPLPGH